MLNSKDFGLEPLDKETVPDWPPHPGMISLEKNEENRKEAYETSLIPGRLASDLVTAAYRLMELSFAYQGKYQDGCEIPESSQAAAIGAIITSCAAFEAMVNELMVEVEFMKQDGIAKDKCKLFELAMSLSPDKRLEAISAVFGKCIDWGAEPYQSLKYLLSVRKHLLHHETAIVTPAAGFWPSKKLKEIAKIIQSPYPLDSVPTLQWNQHILTPNGARWALEVLSKVIPEIDAIEKLLQNLAQEPKK